MRSSNAKPIVIAQAASGGCNHHLTPDRLTSIGSHPPRVSPCPLSPPVPAVYFSQSASQHQLPDARFPAPALRPRENRRGEKPHVKFACKTRARNSTRNSPACKTRARNLLKKTRRKQKNFRQTRKSRLPKGWRLANYRPASCLSADCLPVRWRPASCPPMRCRSVECRLANWRSAGYLSAGRRL